MPYQIKKQGNKYQLKLKGKVVGTHPSRAAAQKQIAAIESNKGRKHVK